MEDFGEPTTTKKPRTKPKVACDWLEGDIFKLITLVEAEKCLWDASDEAYHNKALRDRAWLTISEHFEKKYAATELNAKWSNLRIQYRGYAARAKTKSGQGAKETPKWKFFNAMRFVGHAETQQTQDTTSNFNFDTGAEGFSSDIEYVSSQQPSTTKRRQQSQNTQIVASEIAATMREAVTVMQDRGNSGNTQTNPNDTFAVYLASELNTLSVDAATLVRKKITLNLWEYLDEERNKF